MSTAGTPVVDRVYVSFVRALLRRIGVGRILSWLSMVASVSSHARFRLKPPDTVAARVADLTASFAVGSALEMREVETLGGERKVLRRLLGRVRAGDVAYDIGTNIGVYTVFLGKAIGNTGCVVGFEPESRSYRRCTDNLRMNLLTNVQLFAYALGKEEGEARLVVDERPSTGVHHVLRPGESADVCRSQLAKVVIGDRFIAEQALPVPAIVKIDVEGMELDVLLGLSATLRRQECRLVCCEVHFAILAQGRENEVPRRIMELLDASHFSRLQWVDRSHLFAFK